MRELGEATLFIHRHEKPRGEEQESPKAPRPRRIPLTPRPEPFPQPVNPNQSPDERDLQRADDDGFIIRTPEPDNLRPLG